MKFSIIKFVGELRKCEKLVENKHFQNETKHLKIFSKVIFIMQLNTWKYFPFLKIAFPENIYFPENILHWTNHSLSLITCLGSGKSIHSRCVKCAKCQIFGTFDTPNTKKTTLWDVPNLIIFVTCEQYRSILKWYGQEC